MRYDSPFGRVQVDFPCGGLSSGPPGGSSQLERRLPPMENRVGLFEVRGQQRFGATVG